MKNKNMGVLGVLFFYLLFASNTAFAHCDTLDGPVVTAAKKAIESENVNLVLVWVKGDDEAKVKEVFQKTISDRKANPAEKDRIDTYFFENLVRIHREGEGKSFDGLKPAGVNTDPIISLTDKAVETGSVADLLSEMNTGLQTAVQNNFKEVTGKKNYNINDVDAGREYVESYVKFLHYVEGVDGAIKKNVSGHGVENSHKEEGSHFSKDGDLKNQLHFSWAIILVLTSWIVFILFKGVKGFRNK